MHVPVKAEAFARKNPERQFGLSPRQWIIGNKLTDATETPNYLEMIHVGSLKAVAPFLVSLIH